MGLDNVDNMMSEAEMFVVATHYSAEHKQFNFERYVKVQRISTTYLKSSRNMGMWD